MVYVHVIVGKHVFILNNYRDDHPELWEAITDLISRWTESWDDKAFEICPITIIFTGGIDGA